MTKKIIKLSLLFSLLFAISIAKAQEKIIKGKIIDKITSIELPFASIHIPNTLQGCISNINGEFELNVTANEDSLQVSYIGYFDTIVAISGASSGIVIIELSPWINSLQEVIVRPRLPEYYIKEAINRYSENVDHKAFETTAYFKETKTVKFNELESTTCDEAVFSTYYPDYSNTTKSNLSKLILHRNLSKKKEIDIPFLKKTEKKMEKIKDKKEEEEEIPNDDNSNTVSFGSTDGGPEAILKIVQNSINLPFLDSSNFKSIDFSFASPSFYNNRELMVIKFTTERSFLSVIYSGKIYLDINSYAFVSLNYTEFFKIPYILQPIITAKVGFTLSDITQKISIKNQVLNNLWYPKEIITSLNISPTKRHFFSKNEVAIIETSQALSIDNINLQTPQIVPANIVFDPKKEYEEQLHNEGKLNWSNINVIR